MRIERDTLGEVQVPDDALYGAQTQRAVENYPISGLREHPVFIRAFVLLKKVAALANFELGNLEERLARAISDGCDEILGEDSFNFDKLNRGEPEAAESRGDDDLRSVPYKIPTPYVS